MPLARFRNGLLAVALWTTILSGQRARGFKPLTYTRFELPNGLVTVINEDHTTPLVGVFIQYRAGSKEETPGHHEEAHLCEHLLFEGSAHQPFDAKAFYGSFGGTSGRWGMTDQDRLYLYETVPTNYVETTLWFEADRMAAPAFHHDSLTFAKVRAIVANERAQDRTDATFGEDKAAILQALFPSGYPYTWDPLGPLPSVDQLSASEVNAFCRERIVPSNAVLAISGDVNPAQVRAWVERYFGPIHRGSAPHVNVPPARIVREKRIVQEDARARVSALRIAWVGAGFSSRDKMALQALGYALAGDRRSGLRKLLINDRGMATDVQADNYDLEKTGIFQISIQAAPAASLTVIEQLVDSAVASARQTTVSASVLADYKAHNRFSTAVWLQARLNRADTLAQGQSWAGDPVLYARQIDQADALTVEDLQRVARQYLSAGRVVLSLIPAGKLDLVSKPRLPYTRVDHTGVPIPGSQPDVDHVARQH